EAGPNRPDSGVTQQLFGDESDRNQQLLLERLKRLRERRPNGLPNLRVCQVVGGKICLRACDPFNLDDEGAAELMSLGLRSIIDLSHLCVLRWQPEADAGAETDGFIIERPVGADDDLVSAIAYRVDCLRSPQLQLRRFLADYAGPCRLCVPDVSAYLLSASAGRPTLRLLREVLDCFPDALAAAMRVLARRDAYPALLVSRDGQQVAAVVVCLMQLLLGEDPSILADMHAASETEFARYQGDYPESEHSARLKESRSTMLQLVDYILETYRSAENYLLKAGLSQQEIRQLKTV
uniref:NR LBD domain-containing protein n=1 Tax=Macrostomum lignano TaxID=282301 RepID=A0A1I8GAB9_9PLAT